VLLGGFAQNLVERPRIHFMQFNMAVFRGILVGREPREEALAEVRDR
jgi:hypothetical protein